MRKFGKDKPDLMEFQIGDSDKVYALPLAASLPAPMLIEMSECSDDDTEAFKFQYRMLKKYMGEDVENLTAGDIRDIINEWYKESEKQGADAGE